MPNKVQVDIYCIDRELTLGDMQPTIEPNEMSFLVDISSRMMRHEEVSDEECVYLLDKIANFIIDSQNAKEEALQYQAVEIQNELISGYHMRLYRAINETTSSLDSIIEVLGPDRLERGKNVSYILLLCNKSQLFSFCSGAGWQVVASYIDKLFSLNIMSRLFNESEQAISSARYRGFTGMIAAQSNNYRKKMRASEISDFGRLCLDLSGQIDVNKCREKLGVVPYARNAKVVKADFKNGFRIKRSLELKGICNLLDRIDTLLQDDPFYQVDDWRGLSMLGQSSRDKKLSKELTNALVLRLVQYLDGGPRLDVFICNEEIATYQNATRYELESSKRIKQFETFNDDEDLFSYLQSVAENYHGAEDKKVAHISSTLREVILTAFNGTAILTTGRLLDQIQVDFMFEEKSYMLLDGVWYQVKEVIQERLNRELPSLARQRMVDYHLPRWIDEDENDYLDILADNHNHAKLHRKRPMENIELCDSLFYDEANHQLVFFHAKDDFTTSMRVLCAQVQSSASLLADIIQNGRVDDLEAALRNLRVIPQIIDRDIFREAFAGRIDIVECILLNSSVDIENHVQDYGSTIAKFELSYLIKSWNYTFPLQIAIP